MNLVTKQNIENKLTATKGGRGGRRNKLGVWD